MLATAKIHILKQFTTAYLWCLRGCLIVLATAKIHILKQFTTCPHDIISTLELCLLLQRYTFWSNSQQDLLQVSSRAIVLATAKIHILKQFTTVKLIEQYSSLLCLLLQRYTFWSNSQPRTLKHSTAMDCACYCKDTHFEAIHNTRITGSQASSIVLATAKIHILKQFTTVRHD